MNIFIIDSIFCHLLETIPTLLKKLLGKDIGKSIINIYNDEGDPAKSWWKRKHFRGTPIGIFNLVSRYAYNHLHIISLC